MLSNHRNGRKLAWLALIGVLYSSVGGGGGGACFVQWRKLARSVLTACPGKKRRKKSICYLCDPAVCKELPDLLPHPGPHTPDGHLLAGEDMQHLLPLRSCRMQGAPWSSPPSWPPHPWWPPPCSRGYAAYCYLCDPAVCKELPDLLPHPGPHAPDGCHLLKGGDGLRMGSYGCDGCKNKHLSTACIWNRRTVGTKNEICDAAKIQISAKSDVNRSKQFWNNTDLVISVISH